MFSSSDLIWIDFEAYGGPLDLRAAGTFRYVAEMSTRAIVLAYAIGDAPALTWHADGAILDWDNAPDELRAAFERGATFAATRALTPPSGTTPRSDFLCSCRKTSSIRWCRPASPICRPILSTPHAISAAPASRKTARS